MRRILIYIFMFLILLSGKFLFAQDIIKDTERELKRVLENDPESFFLEFHHDNQDFFPVPKDEHFNLRLNVSPLTLIFNGLGMRLKIVGEYEYIPQIDLAGTFGKTLLLELVYKNIIKPAEEITEESIEIPNYSAYSFGINFAKSVDKKTRLFMGVQSTKVNFNIQLSTSTDDNDDSITNLPGTGEDTYISAGIEYHTRPGKYIVVQTAYGTKYNRIISRICMWYNALELGINIYPESWWVVRPFMAYHLCF